MSRTHIARWALERADAARLSVAASVLLGCSLAAACTPPQMVGGGDDPPSAAEVNDKGTDLEDEAVSYLSIGPPGAPEDPASWESFFADGEARVERVETSFTEWSDLLDEAADGGRDVPADLFDYRDALGSWVVDQREQLTLSRACYDSGQVSESAALNCYSEMLAVNGARWQADADHLNRWLGN